MFLRSTDKIDNVRSAYNNTRNLFYIIKSTRSCNIFIDITRYRNSNLFAERRITNYFTRLSI